MLILTKAILAMMIGFLLAVAFGVILIPLLKKRKINQHLSVYLQLRHENKKNTPTMGGLIFIIPTLLTIIILYYLDKINFSYSLFIIIFTFIGYAIIGFIDDYLIIKKNNNKGLTEKCKLLLQLIIAITFFYFFMKGGNEPLFWIHTLGIKINIGFFYGLFILFVLLASSNAVNITDGLDGLAGGLCVIALLTFGIISFNTGWLDGYEDIAIFCFILIGTILGFLVYNVSPAKIFMGDTGSLCLGATIGALAILTRHELLLVLIGIVFVLETLSCIIQILYYKLTKKRLFPMTPIHHSFEKIGWNERDIVKLFWIIGLIASMTAIAFGVWL
ncbi:MAG: phospho-N-acetylmuramoyl-pentapeptide-transferase [Bacilli bacterium]